MGRLRSAAHDWALVFFGGLGSYLVSFFLAAQLGILLSRLAASLSSAAWVRVAMGMVAMDLSKAPAMLLCALVLAHAVGLSPLTLALGLTVMVYLLDLLMALLLHQAPWLWGQPVVLVLRLLSAGLLAMMVLFTVRRRRRK